MIRRLGSTVPFPPMPPPPAPAPGVPAARQAPRRPCAPPAPSPPAAAGEKRRPPERPEALLSSSWPSATLKRPQVRRGPGLGPGPGRAQPPAPPRAPATCATSRPAGSGHSPARATAAGTSAGAGPDDGGRFSLSLTPEAILVIQRRHLEKQLLARPRRPCPSPSAHPRRLLGPCPRAAAAGLGRRPPPPLAPLLPVGLQPPDPRPLLKVSLLNERHKYDDVEYEEETAAVDEGLVRKCAEWLRGVESAAAARGRARAPDALPHLSTL
ncbi:proline-rich protein 18 [Cynocephalus volans]|uniref:proline-rich protein 18 n=1 Tax=Cynocephalus volans TaxID=110931 RepID=UPI002FC79D2D